jgi:integrase
METETRKRDRGEGGLFRIAESKMWYTKVHGKRRSTGTSIKEEAKKILQARLGRAVLGIADPSEQRKIKYEDARDALLSDYANGPQNGRSLVTKADGSRTVWGLNHLNKFFGGFSVVDINTKLFREFIDFRQNMEASNGTINRNLCLLRRMLRLNARDTNMPVPYFPLLKEAAPRQGFVEHEQFKKLFAELPERLRAFVLFLYTTGCRSGEAKKLCWNQIDRKERVVRVEGEQTKNAAPRTIPLADAVVKLLEEVPQSKRDGLLFPVGCFRKAWQNACVRAGLGTLTKGPANGGYGHYAGLTPHDLRRSAVRNLRKAGISEGVAMSVSGHKTREVFERYNIKSVEDQRDAMRRVGSSLGQVLKSAKVRK